MEQPGNIGKRISSLLAPAPFQLVPVAPGGGLMEQGLGGLPQHLDH